MKGWGLATAVRTLTIIPFPGKESESGATGFYWYVPVGALLGGILYFVSKINLPTPLLATLIVALLALLTRAFHLDGLADTFDGFGGGNSKERRLEIMRDHQTGVFGVTALLLTLIFKVVATTLLLEGGLGAFIFYAPLLSRFFVVAQALFNPYARESGKAFSQINDGKLRHLLVSFGWVLLPSSVSLSPLGGSHFVWGGLGGHSPNRLKGALLNRRGYWGCVGGHCGTE